MFRQPRIAHIRYKDNKIYHKSKINDPTRIVTVVWNFDAGKNLLVYGATVYTASSHQDRWVKKLHTQKALTRYYETAVLVKFRLDVEFSRVAMDKYIADHLVYRFGCKSKVLDYVNQLNMPSNILQRYDPDYYPEVILRKSGRKCRIWFPMAALALSLVAGYITTL